MKKKFLAFITSLMLMVGLFGVMPMTVNAATNTTLNISNGNIVFASSGVTQSGLAVAVADSYTIIGTNNFETVSVTDGTHNITLQNATIAANSLESAFSITGGTVNLTLEGSNTLSSNNDAGLQVSNVAALNILSSSTGSLTANGGGYSAGIGGNSAGGGGLCGNITINGGTVNANGGVQSAGIGSTGSGSGGNITINGGTVNAIGGEFGAGIGSKINGKNLKIKITGGNVNATGGNRAAGIGSGLAGKDNQVEISGGTVNAIGGSGSASIGNGCNNGAFLSTGATIKITGGSVRASSMSSVAPPSNGSTPVYLTTIALPSGIPANSSCVVKVDNVDFNVPNTHSDGKIYLYLTAAEHTVGLTYNAKTCSATETIFANDNNVMTLAYTPTVSSVTVPANASYKAGTNLDFTVTYDAAVDVTGSPSLPITLNIGGTVQATYVSGSGTAALVFRYTVAAGNTDTDGITVSPSINLNGGTITYNVDGTINATLNLNNVGSTAGVLVDTTVPIVTGVTDGLTYTTSKSPTFNEGTATLRKDAGTTEPYISGTAIPASGTYVLTVTDLAGNITIVNFTINIAVTTYTVKFNTNGGSTVNDLTGVAFNTTISKPIDPTKNGCTFGGWFKDTALTQPWNFTTDKVTANTELYAKWIVNAPAPTPTASPQITPTTTPNSTITDPTTGAIVDISGATFPAGVTSVFFNTGVMPTTGTNSKTFNVVTTLIGNDKALSNLKNLVVYDLKLVDQDGNVIKSFTGKVKVKIPVPAGMIGNIHVLWYDESTGKLQDMGAKVVDGYIEFETDHFSYYAIAQMAGLAAGASVTDNAKPITENGMPYAVIAFTLAVGMIAFKQKKAKK